MDDYNVNYYKRVSDPDTDWIEQDKIKLVNSFNTIKEFLVKKVDIKSKTLVFDIDLNYMVHIFNILGSITNPKLVEKKEVKKKSDTIFTKTKYNNNAASIGKQGENFFEDNFNKVMTSDFVLTNTSKIGKKGDFIIEWESVRTKLKHILMIDIKNYSKAVPTLEINKFYRDIECHSNSIFGGICISLNSKFSGTTENTFEFKRKLFYNGYKWICLLQSNNMNIISEIIKHMCYLEDMTHLSNSVEQYMNSKKLMYHVNRIRESLDKFSLIKTTLTETRTILDKQYINLLDIVMKLEAEILADISGISIIELPKDDKIMSNIPKPKNSIYELPLSDSDLLTDPSVNVFNNVNIATYEPTEYDLFLKT